MYKWILLVNWKPSKVFPSYLSLSLTHTKLFLIHQNFILSLFAFLLTLYILTASVFVGSSRVVAGGTAVALVDITMEEEASWIFKHGTDGSVEQKIIQLPGHPSLSFWMAKWNNHFLQAGSPFIDHHTPKLQCGTYIERVMVDIREEEGRSFHMWKGTNLSFDR